MPNCNTPYNCSLRNTSKGFSLLEVQVMLVLASMVLIMAMHFYIQIGMWLQKCQNTTIALEKKIQLHAALLKWRSEHEVYVDNALLPVQLQLTKKLPTFVAQKNTVALQRAYYKIQNYNTYNCTLKPIYTLQDNALVSLDFKTCMSEKKPMYYYTTDYLVSNQNGLWQCDWMQCEMLVPANIEIYSADPVVIYAKK